MINKKKIRIMTALAIYDKHYGEKDRQTEGNYRRDYVYKKNCWTRIYVIIGFLICAGFYGLNLLFVEEINLATFDFIGLAKKMGFLLIGILVLYSIIGTVIGRREYKEAEKRLKSYYALLDKLHTDLK